MRDKIRQHPFVGFCRPLPRAQKHQARRGKSIDSSVRQLRQRQAGFRQRAKCIIVKIEDVRNRVRICRRRVRSGRRRVNGIGRAFRVLRAQLQRRDHECSSGFRFIHSIGVKHALVFEWRRRRGLRRRYCRATSRVAERVTGCRSWCGSRSGSYRHRCARRCPGAHDRHVPRDFDLKNSGISIRGKIRQRKPPRWKQQVPALIGNVGHAHALIRIAQARGKRPAIVKKQSDFSAGRNCIVERDV